MGGLHEQLSKGLFFCGFWFPWRDCRLGGLGERQEVLRYLEAGSEVGWMAGFPFFFELIIWKSECGGRRDSSSGDGSVEGREIFQRSQWCRGEGDDCYTDQYGCKPLPSHSTHLPTLLPGTDGGCKPEKPRAATVNATCISLDATAS